MGGINSQGSRQLASSVPLCCFPAVRRRLQHPRCEVISNGAIKGFDLAKVLEHSLRSLMFDFAMDGLKDVIVINAVL
jgi:hypothetical protein